MSIVANEFNPNAETEGRGKKTIVGYLNAKFCGHQVAIAVFEGTALAKDIADGKCPMQFKRGAITDAYYKSVNGEGPKKTYSYEELEL